MVGLNWYLELWGGLVLKGKAFHFRRRLLRVLQYLLSDRTNINSGVKLQGLMSNQIPTDMIWLSSFVETLPDYPATY